MTMQEKSTDRGKLSPYRNLQRNLDERERDKWPKIMLGQILGYQPCEGEKKKGKPGYLTASIRKESLRSTPSKRALSPHQVDPGGAERGDDLPEQKA